MHLDVVVSPQVKEKIYGQRENRRCPTTWKDSGFTPASDSSFGENDSVTTAALLNRNASGKTTHTPQLKALRLDNPSLQKASRHE
jgi:hypothetical protein